MERFERAIHDEVIAEGGTELARRMGVNRTRLLDCANPNREAHRMNIELLGQVLAHVSLDGRRRILAALVEEFGFQLVEKDKPQILTINNALLRLHADLGDVARLAVDAQADGHVCGTEKAQLLREADEVVESLAVFKESVRKA
ncbi:Phage regulatory protein CII (CP76) [compost metagenome]